MPMPAASASMPMPINTHLVFLDCLYITNTNICALEFETGFFIGRENGGKLHGNTAAVFHVQTNADSSDLKDYKRGQ
jgi:hypothetical protein